MEMVFVNLTPHKITLFKGGVGGKKVEIEPSGKVGRLSTFQKQIGEVEGIPVYKTIYDGLIINNSGGGSVPIERVKDLKLSLVTDDTKFYILIVSLPTLMGLVKTNIPLMSDNYMFVAPDTNNAIRDEDGRIIGVKNFIIL